MTTKIILAIVFIGNTLLFAQKDGAVKGKVSDKVNSVGVAFAPIVLKKDGKTVARTVADADGNYSFCRLRPGVYTLKTNVVGYHGYTVLNLRIDSVMVDQNMDIENTLIPGQITVMEKSLPETDNAIENEDVYVVEVPAAPEKTSNDPAQEGTDNEDQANVTRVSEEVRPVITVFPNPINESASIQIDSEIDITGGVVRVFDVSGMEVRALSFSGKTILFERKDLAAGVYMYNVTSMGRSIAMGRMIIL